MTFSPLLVAAVVAGFGFFAWPLRMNQAGLSAAAMFLYAAVAIAAAAISSRPRTCNIDPAGESPA